MNELKEKLRLIKDELASIEKQLSDIEKKSELTIMNASQTSTATLKWNGGINTTYNLPRLDIVTSGTIVVAENVQSGSLWCNTLVKTTINNEPIFLLASKAHTP
jgi:23S rRNA-/tRNA-specific pseudouridylate synthase